MRSPYGATKAIRQKGERNMVQKELTKRSLDPVQLQLVEAIEELWFGRIEQISVRDGKPCYEPATQIVQEIKLESEIEPRVERTSSDLTLKSEFERLFNQLDRLRDGLVDIEIRHGVPFRLIVRRFRKELVP
jgi:hypothetical protein